jgi:hypothetical protein
MILFHKVYKTILRRTNEEQKESKLLLCVVLIRRTQSNENKTERRLGIDRDNINPQFLTSSLSNIFILRYTCDVPVLERGTESWPDRGPTLST